MLVKLLGSFFVIATTSFAGMKKAEEYKEGYRQTRCLQRILYMIESEIRYSHNHLEEVFAHLTRQVQEPYCGWLYYMKQQMHSMDSEPFSELWEKGIDRYLKRSGLPTIEVDRLIQLGSQLGNVDLDLQLRLLEVYGQQLEYQIEEMQAHTKINVKLCHCFGVMSGLILAILLI